MEARVAVIEAEAARTKADVSDLRARVKALRPRVKTVQQASGVKKQWKAGTSSGSGEGSSGKKKAKGKKAKDKKDKGNQAGSDAPPPPKMFCTECNAGFPSKTKLFLHLKVFFWFAQMCTPSPLACARARAHTPSTGAGGIHQCLLGSLPVSLFFSLSSFHKKSGDSPACTDAARANGMKIPVILEKVAFLFGFDATVAGAASAEDVLKLLGGAVEGAAGPVSIAAPCDISSNGNLAVLTVPKTLLLQQPRAALIAAINSKLDPATSGLTVLGFTKVPAKLDACSRCSFRRCA